MYEYIVCYYEFTALDRSVLKRDCLFLIPTLPLTLKGDKVIQLKEEWQIQMYIYVRQH